MAQKYVRAHENSQIFNFIQYLIALMRKIEEKMLIAFKERRDWHSGNTRVVHNVFYETCYVFLHGSCIARKNINNEVIYSFGGYNSMTTRSRLRALGCNVTVKRGVPYRDGRVWYGDF